MLITIAFGPDALSNIATDTYLNIFFFLLFIVFALSFFGLFEITLPSSWGNKLDQKADKGGVLGIFFMAATLVVISFSCTAGFLGTLLANLAEGNSYMCPLAGFTGFGTGIALPFMIFAFFPSMLNSLPKSGGWMNTFKVTVAFIELALAVKFLANADNVNDWGFITREVFITLWVAIFGMMTLYLLGVFKTSHDDETKHISVGRIMFATISLAFTIYLIPGLWGAPLKIISSFPPPHHYSESPNGFGGHAGNTSSESTSPNAEIAALENKRVVGPEGLMLFKNDYESALKYAKLVNKPLFVDFTGNACVNCRLMESTVWVTPEVLPKEEQKEVFWFGKQRTLETIGNKYAYFQSTKYGSSSQPQYVLINHDETNATPGTMGTETNATTFAYWLQTGINNFKNK
jgi:thiol:disulfide interchange protein DsbD